MRLSALWLTTLCMTLCTIWGAFALWYQAPGGHALKSLSALLWVGLSISLLFALWHSRAALGLTAFAVAFAALAFWFQAIRPSHDRLWADDVAQMTAGVIDGNQVTLRNVRSFEWRSDSDYTQRWVTRRYDLDQLHSVDLIMSYWSGSAIAHMLISFGFRDGEQVAFSVEIRRERHENFSETGGFFKQFELSIIAADERDVVRVRTNVRGEDDYLYRINISQGAMRSLFLAYVEQANSLVRAPRFYNTITVNCTTLVYHMMKHIVGYLPLDYRLLFTGYLPEYVYQVGGLDSRYSLEELRVMGRITDRAKISDRSAYFSADIRRGVPVIATAASR